MHEKQNCMKQEQSTKQVCTSTLSIGRGVVSNCNVSERNCTSNKIAPYLKKSMESWKVTGAQVRLLTISNVTSGYMIRMKVNAPCAKGAPRVASFFVSIPLGNTSADAEKVTTGSYSTGSHARVTSPLQSYFQVLDEKAMDTIFKCVCLVVVVRQKIFGTTRPRHEFTTSRLWGTNN